LILADIEDPPALARDQGLVRGIGAAALAATIVNGVVGAGIFTLPAAVALAAGPGAPWAYLVCGVVMAAIVLCFAEAGSRVPTSGGVYGTVDAAFGPAAGFVTGMLMLVADMMAGGGVGALLVDVLGRVVPAVADGAGRVVAILVLFAALAAANLLSVRATTRVISVATAVKLLPLIFFLGLGVVFGGHATPAGPPPVPWTGAGFGRALILTLFALCGMEVPLAASGEVRNAHRVVPQALVLAMLAVVGLYVGVQMTAQHLLGTNLAASRVPLADAAAQVAPWARAVMLAGAGVSATAWLASDVFGTSRVIFAMARDGRLPRVFGVLDSRRHVPVIAVLVYVATACVLALTGTFLELVVLSALAVVGIYSLACAAAWVLHRRGVAQAGAPMNLRVLPAAAAVGLAGMAAMLWAAKPIEVLGLVGVVGASLAAYAVMERR
jgi:amino acid transporter